MISEQLQNWAAHLPDRILKECRRNRTQALLHTCAIGNFVDESKHRAVRPEPINEHILIYCYAGKGYYTIDGIRHQISPGEFFVVPAGIAHEYGNIPGDHWTILWVHYAGTLAEDITTRLTSMPATLPCPRDKVLAVFTEMLEPIATGWNEANLALTTHVLWHFLGLFTISSCVGLPSAEQGKETVSDRVIALFNADLSRRYTLSNIAGAVGLSPSHLSARFKAETGASPIDYLIHQRIIEAARLLETSGLRVGEVSRQVGYEDTKFFSKSFSRIMGLSPRAYRERHA